MDINYGDGTVLALWYDNWLAVAGSGVALLLTLRVLGRSGWGVRGLLLKVLVLAALLATMPLALARLGMDVTIADQTTLGYLSLAGAGGSVVVGLPYLFGKSAATPTSRQRAEPVEVATPEYGVPLAPEPGEATRTLVAGGTLQEQGVSGIQEAGAPVSPTAPAPTAWLLFRSGSNVGQSIPLAPEVTTIGRSSENDVVLDDATVSRQHARISLEEGKYVMEDTGSSGGTMVEGAPVRRTALMSGSTIRIGETELVFMQGEPTSAPGATGVAGPQGRQTGETVILEPPATVLAWLAVTAGSDRGKISQLRDGDTTIGRDPGNDVVIADAAVSRRHALIRHQDGGFLLMDLGSSQGVLVNGQAIAGKPLASGGSITLGQTQMVVVSVEPGEAPPPAALEGATMVAQPAASGDILVARSGPDAGKSFTMRPGDNAIGRDPECQVVLNDTAISRRHALVRRQADGFVVYDLGSRTGTLVDGRAITGTEVRSGDVISIGRTEMVFMQPQQTKG